MIPASKKARAYCRNLTENRVFDLSQSDNENLVAAGKKTTIENNSIINGTRSGRYTAASFPFRRKTENNPIDKEKAR